MGQCPVCGVLAKADDEKRKAKGSERVPKFLPRKGVLSREYHVLVIWPDGRRTKVGRFFQRTDAAQWIARKSKEWLAQNSIATSSNLNMLEQRSA
jgi:hypothetical protein